MLPVREIAYGSDDYNSAVDLRRRILRFPLGMDYPPEQLQAEHLYTHIAAFLSETIVGYAYLKKEGQALRLKQMAVDQGYQRRDIGRAIMVYAEEWAKKNTFDKIVLTARQTAIPFYEKCGYATTGDIFVELTIPHMEMFKFVG